MLALPTPARAAQFLYTITGNLVLDELTYDELQLFGPALSSTFSAAFVVDDAMPQAAYSYGATGSSATGGGIPGTVPPVSATLTIGGITYAIRQGNSSSGPIIGPDGDPFGGTSLEQDYGSVAKSSVNGSLALSTTYYREAFCCFPVGYQFDATGDDLSFALYSPAFSGPDYRQTGTFALASSGGYFNSHVQSGPVPGLMTQIRFQAQALTVASLAAVPEIGTWLMMIAGMGCAGQAVRRGRQSLPVTA
jgi:hypothetical protein